MMKLEEIGTRARGAEPVLRIMGTETKNRVLKKAAENLVADADAIIAANALDMEHGREKGMSKGLLDRLFLDQSRIEAMAEGHLSGIRAGRSDRGSSRYEKTAERSSDRAETCSAWCCRNHL